MSKTRARLLSLVGSMVCAAAVATGSWPVGASTVVTTEAIDLTKTPIRGLPPSFKVTLYRDASLTDKQPLIVLIPQFGAQISDSPYRQQAEQFVGPRVGRYANATWRIGEFKARRRR
jgi:hypothetical protein